MKNTAAIIFLSSALCVSCIRPAEERALADLEVGLASLGSLSIVASGANVMSMGDDELVLWAQSPVFDLAVQTPVARSLRVRVRNSMPGATFASGIAALDPDVSAGPTDVTWRVDIPADGADLHYAPADEGVADSFRFAVMGDIQTGLPTVVDIFDEIAVDPSIRFVISTGDLVEEAKDIEYQDLLVALEELPVPYFSTIGNHELADTENRWPEYFGRHTVHFDFKGVSYSLVDTGNATIDPLVYDWLDEWLSQARDRVHVYGQHYPPFDPVGVRGGSMNSRKEAAKLLSRLAAGEVDVTFYGHLHSYYSYENAGIPAYISGGGGAIPEHWDGIGRHFLTVDVDPQSGIRQVGVVRVD